MNFLVRSCENKCSGIGWRIQRVACMKAALAINAGISETVDDLLIHMDIASFLKCKGLGLRHLSFNTRYINSTTRI